MSEGRHMENPWSQSPYIVQAAIERLIEAGVPWWSDDRTGADEPTWFDRKRTREVLEIDREDAAAPWASASCAVLPAGSSAVACGGCSAKTNNVPLAISTPWNKW